jgi:hypothetical protein
MHLNSKGFCTNKDFQVTITLHNANLKTCVDSKKSFTLGNPDDFSCNLQPATYMQPVLSLVAFLFRFRILLVADGIHIG